MKTGRSVLWKTELLPQVIHWGQPRTWFPGKYNDPCSSEVLYLPSWQRPFFHSLPSRFSHTSHSFLPSLIFFTSHKHTDQSQQQGSQSKIKCDLAGSLWEGHLYLDQPGEAGLRGLCGSDMVGMRWGTRQSSWSDHSGLGQVTITLWIRPEDPKAEFGGSVTKADDRADDSNVDYSPDLDRTVNSLSWALITNGTFIRFLKGPMDRLILAHSNW